MSDVPEKYSITKERINRVTEIAVDATIGTVLGGSIKNIIQFNSKLREVRYKRFIEQLAFYIEQIDDEIEIGRMETEDFNDVFAEILNISLKTKSEKKRDRFAYILASTIKSQSYDSAINVARILEQLQDFEFDILKMLNDAFFDAGVKLDLVKNKLDDAIYNERNRNSRSLSISGGDYGMEQMDDDEAKLILMKFSKYIIEFENKSEPFKKDINNYELSVSTLLRLRLINELPNYNQKTSFLISTMGLNIYNSIVGQFKNNKNYYNEL